MSLARRSKVADSGSTSDPTLPDKGFWASFPDLLSFTSQSKWEDGSSRLTGTMMVFTEGGQWKCWLHDRDACQGCFVTGTTIEGLLKAANAAVGASGGDWRPDRKGGKRA